jgi:hypothetical protein
MFRQGQGVPSPGQPGAVEEVLRAAEVLLGAQQSRGELLSVHGVDQCRRGA